MAKFDYNENFVNELGDFVKNGLIASGVDADRINVDQSARAMPLLVGMVVHPIFTKKEDVKFGDAIPGIDAATGKEVKNGFAYLDTKEGMRLTMSQITRLGNGLSLEGTSQKARFASFCSKVSREEIKGVKVEARYSNTLGNGQNQNLPVFSVANEE